MEDSLQPRIKAVIGLGNPGRGYEKTRHNLGFKVVEALAGDSNFTAGEGNFFFNRTAFDSYPIVLLKPTTYMNRSGLAVSELSELSGFQPREMLVIADDFNLPLGRIRLRRRGSDGGHNGLASVIYHLASDDFPRIRLGIGPVPEGMPSEEYVLEDFSENEGPAVAEMIKRASEAAMTWVISGYDVAAARHNRAIDEN